MDSSRKIKGMMTGVIERAGRKGRPCQDCPRPTSMEKWGDKWIRGLTTLSRGKYF